MKIKKFYMAALAAAVLAGCSNDDELAGTQQSKLPEDGVIRIATQVNQLAETRATGATAYKGTTLGLYIKPTATTAWDNTQDKYTYPNVKFTTTDRGTTWMPDFTSMLWKGEDVEYEYYAYAPADTKADSDNKVAYDLSDQASKSEVQNDLLWASDKNKASALVTAQKLNITFDHALCKVAVELTLGDEFYQNGVVTNPVQDVSISTTRISGSMNVLDGTLTADANATGTLAFKTDDNGHTAGNATTDGTYTTPYLFYAPGSETFTVTINTTGSRTFVYTHSEAFTFAKGNRYLIKLKMGKDVLQLNEITVEEWKKGVAPNEGKIETE